MNLTSRCTPINDQYQTCERTAACFCMYPQETDPRWITQEIGITPTSWAKKGEPKITPNGKTIIARTTNWLLDSEDSVSSKDLRRHLDWLLAQLLPVEGKIKQLQNLPGMKMCIRTVWWSKYGDGSPTLWPEQMKGMVDLNLEFTVSFSYYGDEENTEEEPAKAAP